MIKVIKKAAIMVICLTAITEMASCAATDPYGEADAFIEQYMSAMEAQHSDNGFDAEQHKKVVSYEYGGDTSDPRPYYLIDDVKDYVMKDKEKVNDDLFVYTLLLASYDNLDLFRRIYFYVVKIDGAFYVTNDASQIPETLRTNFDRSKYVYYDPSIDTVD